MKIPKVLHPSTVLDSTDSALLRARYEQIQTAGSSCCQRVMSSYDAIVAVGRWLYQAPGQIAAFFLRAWHLTIWGLVLTGKIVTAVVVLIVSILVLRRLGPLAFRVWRSWLDYRREQEMESEFCRAIARRRAEEQIMRERLIRAEAEQSWRRQEREALETRIRQEREALETRRRQERETAQRLAREEQERRDRHREDMNAKMREEKESAYQRWRAECHAWLKQRPHPFVAPRCIDLPCRNEPACSHQTGVPFCKHSIGEMYRFIQDRAGNLRKDSCLWHPDKFMRDEEKHHEQIATAMFQILSALREEKETF